MKVKPNKNRCEKKTVILPINNDELIVSTSFTYIPGTWFMYLMARESELDLSQENIDISIKGNERVFISDGFVGIVRDSEINKDDVENTPLDSNLKIIYDDLVNLKKELEEKIQNGDFNGSDGFSPIAKVEKIENGVEISITDKNGTTNAKVLNGTNGVDGISPSVQVAAIENGHKVSITDKDGLTQFDVLNGEKGEPGKDYEHSEEFSQLAEQVRSDAESSKSSEEQAKQYADSIKASSEQIAQNKADIEDLKNNPSVDLDVLEKLAIKDTATGNPTVITDSADWRMKDLKVYGESSQLRTTGKNLVDIPNIDINTPSEVVPCNLTKDVVLSAQKQPTVEKSIWRFKATSKDGSKQYIEDSSINEVLKATEENPIVSIEYRSLYITSGAYEDIMVEYGTAPTKYEPYTGGKPSPSVEYPQEIVSKEVNEVKIIAKNLFNKTGYRPLYEIDLKKGTTISLSCEKEWDDSIVEVNYINGLKDVITCSLKGNRKVGSIQLKEDLKSIMFRGTTSYPQVEVGSVATEYEPYKEQLVSLQPPKPLQSSLDGKIADEVDVVSGVYRYNMEKVFFNGSEEYFQDYQSQSGYYGRYFYFPKGLGVFTSRVLCNCLPYVEHSWAKPEEGFSQNANSQIHLKFSNKRLGITDSTPLEEKRIAFANYLKKLYESENPLYVIIGVNETTEPIPPTDLEKIKALKMYYPNTVVHTGTETEVTYIADPKLYIDKKLGALNTVQSKLLELESKV